MYTKQEVIEQLNDLGKGRYVVVDIPNYANEDSRCIAECINPEEPHGLGTEFQNPWEPTIGTLKHRCRPGCPKKYRCTEKEALELLKGKGQGRYKVLSIDNYKGRNSKVNVFCDNCGPGWQLSPKPWKPSVDALLSGSGCPKCSGNYNRDYEEVCREIAPALPSVVVK